MLEKGLSCSWELGGGGLAQVSGGTGNAKPIKTEKGPQGHSGRKHPVPDTPSALHGAWKLAEASPPLRAPGLCLAACPSPSNIAGVIIIP